MESERKVPIASEETDNRKGDGKRDVSAKGTWKYKIISVKLEKDKKEGK